MAAVNVLVAVTEHEKTHTKGVLVQIAALDNSVNLQVNLAPEHAEQLSKDLAAAAKKASSKLILPGDGPGVPHV